MKVVRDRSGGEPTIRRWLSLGCLFAMAMSLLATVAAQKSAADYFIHSLPGQPEGPLLRMHAGHVEISHDDGGYLFFWHYQQRHMAERSRTLIWFNGGPGCSSMDGSMMEIGPYRVLKDGKLAYNEGSWDEFANLLFIDSPVGTGFSYVDTNKYRHELPEIGADIVTFLEKFFAMFPEYEEDDIYIGGESYAGQFIPYIARSILDRNLESGHEHQWNLSGLLIGNGWIDPLRQYPAYHKMALEADLYKGDQNIIKKVEQQQAKCLKEIEAQGNNVVDSMECEDILQIILEETGDSDGTNRQCYNMYDIRLQDTFPDCGMKWPPDLSTVTPWLREKDVIAALHINPDKRTGWTECSGSVSAALQGQKARPSIHLLPGIIEAGVPILLFSGNKDLICNYFGTEALIQEMSWNNGQGFEMSPGIWAPKRQWTVADEPAGFWQEARNLTYVQFYNASHMVPFDWPRRTRDMLDRFMGVDIGDIGGRPIDSRIDGEKGLETSVGGHPNSTIAQEEEEKKLQEAEWRAYYKSGEVVLVIVAIAASVWGWWVWRERRRNNRWSDRVERGEYAGLSMNGSQTFARANGARKFRGNGASGDLEAGDFDEAELDDLHTDSPIPEEDEEDIGNAAGEDKRYDVGSEDDETTPRAVSKEAKVSDVLT